MVLRGLEASGWPLKGRLCLESSSQTTLLELAWPLSTGLVLEWPERLLVWQVLQQSL